MAGCRLRDGGLGAEPYVQTCDNNSPDISSLMASRSLGVSERPCSTTNTPRHTGALHPLGPCCFLVPEALPGLLLLPVRRSVTALDVLLAAVMS